MLYYISGRVARKGKNTVDKVRYSIYCIYTADNKIYIGLSKNPQLRIHQHWRKSSNERLRTLIDDPSVDLYSKIFRDNLTLKEANELEKMYIARYRNYSKYTVLNILSGGRAIETKNIKIEKFSEVRKSTRLTDEEIIKMIYKYSRFGKRFKTSHECKQYGISVNYFRKILRGNTKKHLPGPLLGKDYQNG